MSLRAPAVPLAGPVDESRTRRSKRAAPEADENTTNEAAQSSSSQSLSKAPKLTAASTSTSRRPALVDISNSASASTGLLQAVAGIAEKILTRSQAKAMEKPSKRRGVKRGAKDDDSSAIDEAADESDGASEAEPLEQEIESAKEPEKPREKTPSELIAEWEARDLASQTVENAALVFNHLRASETRGLPHPRYMDRVQGDLSFSMRAILIDWLVEVAEEYNLQSQTLFLAVSYVDRFLDKVAIDRSKLQLVGVTAMLLAAKYWEIYPPSIEDFVYISDNTYKRDEVVQMESAILSTLKFGLTVPTPWDFSKKFGKSAGLDKRNEQFVEYLLELFLLEAASLQYKPSLVAASAVFLAQWNTYLTAWTPKMSQETGFQLDEIQPCVRDMQAMLVRNFHAVSADPNSQEFNHLKAVREKFSSDKLCSVAKIKPRTN